MLFTYKQVQALHQYERLLCHVFMETFVFPNWSFFLSHSRVLQVTLKNPLDIEQIKTIMKTVNICTITALCSTNL